ncbi:hypothetical protein DL95DRAFT_404918 [Leptodontidium sp. 2 PMI_412]|nr:hypothetical protein DL95DRAFT_404918 [Leptodontidium sp. 2 PMI_412]
MQEQSLASWPIQSTNENHPKIYEPKMNPRFTNNATNSQAAELVTEPCHLEGFPSLAHFIGRDTDAAIFRCFHELGARNLLYLQSTLNELEIELRKLDPDDLDKRSRIAGLKISAREYRALKTAAGARDNIACQGDDSSGGFTAVQTSFKAPPERSLSAFKRFFSRQDGNILLGDDENLFGVLDHPTDLISLDPSDNDRLNRFLRYTCGYCLRPPFSAVYFSSEPCSAYRLCMIGLGDTIGDGGVVYIAVCDCGGSSDKCKESGTVWFYGCVCGGVSGMGVVQLELDGPKGPAIDASLFNDRRSDATKLYIYTPLQYKATYLKYEARYGLEGEVVQTITDILGELPDIVVGPYRALNFKIQAEKDELGTNARGAALFQYDPDSDGKGRKQWRLIIEKKYASGDKRKVEVPGLGQENRKMLNYRTRTSSCAYNHIF